MSGGPNPPPDPWGLRPRSAVAGRERWEVQALLRRPDLARSLEDVLRRSPRVLGAIANPDTGRVLVTYDPGPGPLDVGGLIRDALDDLPRSPVPAEAAADPTGALAEILRTSLPGTRQVAAASALSAAGFALRFLQGLQFVSAVDSARGAPPSPDGAPPPGPGTGRASLTVPGALGVALTGLDVWVNYHRKRAWRGLGQATRRELRARLVASIVGQDLAFSDRHGTARLANLVTQDTDSIGEFVERGGDQLIEKGLGLLASGGLLASASPLLALFACLPLPLLALPTRGIGKAGAASQARKGELADRYQQTLEDVFGGITDVKSFTAEGRESARLREASRLLSETTLEASSLSSLQFGLAQGIFSGGFYLTALYGARLAARGKIAQAGYLRALYLFPGLLDAVQGITDVVSLYQGAKASAMRLAAVLDARPSIRTGPVRLAAGEVRGEIVFEGVSFGYDPSVKVLDDVSFRVHPGQTLGIVGRTGSGKSTLLRLLLRFYVVDSGRILLDGRDVRELDLEDLRAAVGLVTQEVYLFQGTVRENVLYGRPGATLEQLAGAVCEAEAAELLGVLPGGVEADVGERGRRLSGGERQRVAIARALLKGAPVLALDEATSQLDYETEAAVRRSVRRATRGKTVLMIAHRLSTVRDADLILVLERGRVLERGTHEELLACGGHYAALWRLQLGDDAGGL